MKVVESYNEWKSKFPARSNEALMAHGKKVLEPVGNYYKQQFLDDSGDCHPMRVMSEAV